MQPTPPKFSICIANHNQSHLIGEAIRSCLSQDYKNIEIIVLDDNSTKHFQCGIENVKVFRSNESSGTGGAFNKAMSHATGEFIMLLCADDFLTDPHLVSDIMEVFIKQPDVAHISRYYYQFEDGDPRPVRAWRSNHIIELANNPSGLAFRKSAIGNFGLSNKMFVEVSTLVYNIMNSGPHYAVIFPWDTVAVRIHQSTARSKDYYKKRWISSPVEEWSKVGGYSLQNDFTSLIQIKNYFTIAAVLKECWKFIDLRPINILNPAFLFYAFISIFMPRRILFHLPHIYRITIGRWTTKEIKRPDAKKET